MVNVMTNTRARLILLGALLWAVGVGCIHLGTPFGVFAPAFAWLALLAGLAMAGGTVRLVMRLAPAGVSGLEAVALVALPAALLDGIALTWTPFVYAASATDQRAAAAWLLWFIGTSLAISLAMTTRRQAAL